MGLPQHPRASHKLLVACVNGNPAPMKYEPKALEASGMTRSVDTLYHTPPAPKRNHDVLEMFAYPSGYIHMGPFLPQLRPRRCRRP